MPTPRPPRTPTPVDPRRGRWSSNEARDALSAWRGSGLSLHAFALEQGLKPSRLYRARSRLETPVASPAALSPLFQEVSLRPLAAPVAHEVLRVEVVLRSGRIVRVPAGFDPGALCALVAALED